MHSFSISLNIVYITVNFCAKTPCEESPFCMTIFMSQYKSSISCGKQKNPLKNYPKVNTYVTEDIGLHLMTRQ